MHSCLCVCVCLSLFLSLSLSDPLLFSSVLLFLIVFQILYNRSPTQAQCSFSVLQLLLRFLLNVSILQQIKSCLRNYFVLRKGTTIKLTSSVIQSHQSLCHLATFSDTNFIRIEGKSNEMVMLQLLEAHCVSILTYAIEVIHVVDRDERRRLRVAYNSIYRKVFEYKT